MSRLNSRLVPRFIALSKPYLASEQKWVARGLLALLVALMLTNTAASVLINQQTGEFSSALAARDSDRYWRSIYLTLGLIVIARSRLRTLLLRERPSDQSLAAMDDNPIRQQLLQQYRVL